MTDQPLLLRPDDHASRAPDSTAVVVPTTGQRISYQVMVDDEYGESVKAVVTLRDGGSGSPALERDIIDWTRGRLAHYKCPRSVTFVDSLPRLPSGKMLRRLLTDRYRSLPSS